MTIREGDDDDDDDNSKECLGNERDIRISGR